MKTLVKISNDYFNTLSNDLYIEDINYLVNELNVFCEQENDKFINIVEQEKKYCSDENYNNVVKISAKGYSQNEWQEFTLHYNESELKTKEDKANFNSLVDELKKFFTHKNDYFAEKFEYTEIEGKKFINSEAFDCTSFNISYIEFPESEDVKQAYLDIYGQDFDEIEININN